MAFRENINTGDLSTRSNLTHRLEKRALIGAEQEIYLVNTIRTERLGGEWNFEADVLEFPEE